MQPDVTVSLICTDNHRQLHDCLDSLYESTRRASIEVFVVDNASSDGTSEMLASEFPAVRVIRNESRSGFASNNNQVLERAAGRYVLLLNDDTVVLSGAVDAMVEFMDGHAEADAAGSQLLNADRSLQVSFFRFPRPVIEAWQPLTDRWRVPRLKNDRVTEVDWVCGASLLVRREVTERVGMLDPAFDPLYSEETDWCYRMRQAGGHIYYLPQAQIVHLGGQTMNRMPARRVELLYRKRALFFLRHHGVGAKRLFKACLWLSSLVKLLAWIGLYPVSRSRAEEELPLHLHMVRHALQL